MQKMQQVANKNYNNFGHNMNPLYPMVPHSPMHVPHYGVHGMPMSIY